MSTAIDNFTKQLHDNLEAVEDRAKSIKESIQSAPKKTQAEIQAITHLNRIQRRAFLPIPQEAREKLTLKLDA